MTSDNPDNDKADQTVTSEGEGGGLRTGLLKILDQMVPDNNPLTYRDAMGTPGNAENGDEPPEFDPSSFAAGYKDRIVADVKMDKSGRGGTLDTNVDGLDAKEQAFQRAVLAASGIPSEMLDSVRIVGRVSISSSRWTNGEYRNRAQRFRYQIEFVNREVEGLADEIQALAEHKFAQDPPKKTKGNRVMNLVLADMQIGKSDGGGTEGIVERVSSTIAEFAKRVEEQKPDAVVIFFPGDCLEGNQSQKGRNMGFQTHLTITQQTRVLRRIFQNAAKLVAPHSPELHLAIVNGNHDEADRKINTSPGDGWATEMAIATEDWIRSSEYMSHVSVHYPPEERGYLTFQVKDSVFLVAHGHQWRRGQAVNWWKSHCFYMQAGSMAHFLVHGHEHTGTIKDEGPRTVICAPTIDGGSQWFDGVEPGVFQYPGGVEFISEGARGYGYTTY